MPKMNLLQNKQRYLSFLILIGSRCQVSDFILECQRPFFNKLHRYQCNYGKSQKIMLEIKFRNFHQICSQNNNAVIEKLSKNYNMPQIQALLDQK
jgi:hypothetical protein